MTVRGVDDHDIGACIDQRLGPFEPIFTYAQGAAAAQPAERVFAGVGIAFGLFDVLDLSGFADFLGGEIFFDFVGGFLPSAGDLVQFLVAGNGISISDAVTFGFGGVAPGFQFDVDRSSGTFIALNDATAVPEPGTLTLLGAGLLALFVRRRKTT